MATQNRRTAIQVRCKQAYHYRLSHKREDRNPKGEHCNSNEIFTVERIYKNWCLLDNGYWLPIRMGKEILLIPENFDWYMVNVAPGVSYRFNPDPAAKVDGDFPKQYELVAIVSQEEEWLKTWDNYWLPLCVHPNGERRFLFILQRSEEVAYPDRLEVTGSSRPGLNGIYYIERVGKKLKLWMERPIWSTQEKKSKLFRWQGPHTEWVIDDELVNSPTVFACPENSEDVRHPAEARSVWMVFVQPLGAFAPVTTMSITPQWDKNGDAEDDAWEDDVDEIKGGDKVKRPSPSGFGDINEGEEEDEFAATPLPRLNMSNKNSWILQGHRVYKTGRTRSRAATVVPAPPVMNELRPPTLTYSKSTPLPQSHRIMETQFEYETASHPSTHPKANDPVQIIRHFPRSDFQRRAWGYLEREDTKLKQVGRVGMVEQVMDPRQLQTSPAPLYPSQSNGISIGPVSYPAVGQLNSNAKVFLPDRAPLPRQETYGVAPPPTSHIVTKADLRAALNQVPLVSASTFSAGQHLHRQPPRRANNMQSLLDIQFQPAPRATEVPKTQAPLGQPTIDIQPPTKQFGPPLLTATNGFNVQAAQHGEGQSQPEGHPEQLILVDTTKMNGSPKTTNSGELSPFASPFTSTNGKFDGFRSATSGEPKAQPGQRQVKPRPQRGADLGQCFYHNQLCRASAIVGFPDEVYVDTFHKMRVVCHRVPRSKIKMVST